MVVQPPRISACSRRRRLLKQLGVGRGGRVLATVEAMPPPALAISS